MSCSCRVASWRAFLQGLAQVHKIDSPANALLRGRQFQISRSPLRLRTCFENAGQLRSLHASSSRAQDDAAAPSASSGVSEGESAPAAERTAEISLVGPAKENAQEPGSKATRAKTQRGAPGTEPDSKRSKQATDKKKREPKISKVERTGVSQQDASSPARPKLEEWKIQKMALKEKFPEGWKPMKRLSPDALAGIRALNAQFPDVYTTQALADKFEVPAEAIRRILKSKWQPSVEEEQDRQERWFRRGMSVWERKAALGIKPPKRWREAGIARDPSFHEWSKKATQREKDIEEEEVRQYRAHRDRGAGHRGKESRERSGRQYLSQREKRLLREQQNADEEPKTAGSKAP
ncbi:Required for respiratory growth protein 9 [Paramyrothecium foliicola]|nr:Required for respiratory growth protein 9 [Paramyrothecium foliicola]